MHALYCRHETCSKMVTLVAQISRLIAAAVVAAMVMAGLAPCVMPTRLSALSEHDCCDPAQVEADQAGAAATPVMTTGPQACCLVSSTSRVPASIPAGQGPNVVRQDVPDSPAVPTVGMPDPLSSVAFSHYRARSAPRPPLVTVLLI